MHDRELTWSNWMLWFWIWFNVCLKMTLWVYIFSFLLPLMPWNLCSNLGFNIRLCASVHMCTATHTHTHVRACAHTHKISLLSMFQEEHTITKKDFLRPHFSYLCWQLHIHFFSYLRSMEVSVKSTAINMYGIIFAMPRHHMLCISATAHKKIKKITVIKIND